MEEPRASASWEDSKNPYGATSELETQEMPPVAERKEYLGVLVAPTHSVE